MNQNHGKLINNLDSINPKCNPGNQHSNNKQKQENIQKMRQNKALMKRNKIHSNHT